MAQIKCPNCGKKIEDNETFCPFCGARLVNKSKEVKSLKDVFEDSPFNDEDIKKRNKEIEKARKENEKKEERLRRAEIRKERRSNAFEYAVIALVLAIVGFAITMFYPKENINWAIELFSERLSEVTGTMWNSFVKEFFTFVIWIICLFFIMIGYIIATLFGAVLGPTFCLLGVIAAIIQLKMNQKKIGKIALGVSLAALAIAVIVTVVMYKAL